MHAKHGKDAPFFSFSAALPRKYQYVSLPNADDVDTQGKHFPLTHNMAYIYKSSVVTVLFKRHKKLRDKEKNIHQ